MLYACRAIYIVKQIATKRMENKTNDWTTDVEYEYVLQVRK